METAKVSPSTEESAPSDVSLSSSSPIAIIIPTAVSLPDALRMNRPRKGTDLLPGSYDCLVFGAVMLGCAVIIALFFYHAGLFQTGQPMVYFSPVVSAKIGLIFICVSKKTDLFFHRQEREVEVVSSYFLSRRCASPNRVIIPFDDMEDYVQTQISCEVSNVYHIYVNILNGGGKALDGRLVLDQRCGQDVEKSRLQWQRYFLELNRDEQLSVPTSKI